RRVVGQDDADGEGTLVGVGVRAADGVVAESVVADGADIERAAAAPIEGRRVGGRRGRRARVGEDADVAGEGGAFGGGDVGGDSGERVGLGDDGRAAGGCRGRARGVVPEGDTDREAAFVGVGVRAGNGEGAAAARDHAARGGAVAPD